jgi:hypothetical protein
LLLIYEHFYIERLWVSFEEKVMTVLKCLCGEELVVIKEGRILSCPVEGIIYTYPVPSIEEAMRGDEEINKNSSHQESGK